MTTKVTANIIPTLLGILAAVLVWGVLAGKRLPLIPNERTAFLVLAAIGFAMCGLGIKQTINARVGWLHPINLAGYVVGSIALLITAGVLFNLRLPWITSIRTSLVALAIIGAAKWALMMVYYLFLA